MKLWICRKCEHEVLAKDRPQPIRWTDGHVCSFRQAMQGEIEKMEGITKEWPDSKVNQENLEDGILNRG